MKGNSTDSCTQRMALRTAWPPAGDTSTAPEATAIPVCLPARRHLQKWQKTDLLVDTGTWYAAFFRGLAQSGAPAIATSFRSMRQSLPILPCLPAKPTAEAARWFPTWRSKNRFGRKTFIANRF